MTKHSTLRFLCTPALLALVFSALPGCGSRVGTVTGKVSHKGKAVNGGMVTLVSQDGVRAEAPIRPDGTYSASLPVGTAKVAVELFYSSVPPIVAPRLPRHFQARADSDPTLAPYRDPEKSPLVCQVGGGIQTFDIDLP